MRKALETLAAGLPIAVLALVTQTDPAWALVPVPAPAAGGLIGAAIIGAIVIAKLWRGR